MRFGICTSIDNIDAIQRMGYDYLEASASTIAQMSDVEFAIAVGKAKNASIPVECFSILFPKSMSLIGGSTTLAEVEAYLEKTFSRIKTLGGKIVVFGSGKCRTCPDGICFTDGHKQLVNVTKKTAEIAAKYGIHIVIEPLNCGEANTINTVAEGAMLAADVSMQNVSLLADSFHMFKENEPMTNIVRVGELKHTHIATLVGRAFPVQSDELIESFFAALAKIKYSGTMSIEGKTENLEKDGPAALAVLRALAAKYSV